MSESQRNFLILLAVAVAGVMFSGIFAVSAGFVGMALNIAFAVVMIAFIIVLYRRHSGTIAQLPNLPRLILQTSVITLVIVFATGTVRMPFLPPIFGWSSAAPVLFWGLVLGSGFGIWWSWQQRTSRW